MRTAVLLVLGLLALFFWLRGSVVGWERRDRKGGFFRLWDHSGPGISWNRQSGRWRIRYLPRNRVKR